ncbi:MAG: GGDEF domain-containing protein [Proteobacteria bacterium]|nr:GGDEF domain-containing protein [Pseudomonadota bacterium]MCP4915549.1 GGDEF domain-containing protein [Pseudomonadota bacterium]
MSGDHSKTVADFDDLSEVTMKLSLPRQRRMRRVAVPTIRVVAGPDMLRFTSLSGGEEFVIGRDETAGLQLGDASVSRSHTLIRCDERGEVTVQDLGSTNGTAVNGQSVSRALLRPGDHLEIGAVSLRLDLLGLDELAHLGRVLERLQQAGRDALTGLHTRTFLDTELPDLSERCIEAKVPMATIFVDVDNFKSINDTYGHSVGDEVLGGIARLSMLGVRDTDPIVRYGGEEILILLPGSDEDGATDVAERLRRTVAGHDWGRTAGGLRVTISLGVAQRHAEESQKIWIDRADKAMYAAKQAGKNRVVRAQAYDPFAT